MSAASDSRRLVLVLSLVCCGCILLASGCGDNGNSRRNATPEIDREAELESVRVYLELGQYDKARMEVDRLLRAWPGDRQLLALRDDIDRKAPVEVFSERQISEAAEKLKADPYNDEARTLLSKAGSAAAPALNELLKHKTTAVRIAAARAIASNPSEASALALFYALDDTSADVVFLAHTGLCRLTSTGTKMILDSEGLPDRSALRTEWRTQLLASGRCGELMGPTPTPFAVANPTLRSVTQTPLRATPSGFDTPQPSQWRTAKPVFTPTASPSPTIKVTRTPEPTPTPKPTATPRPSPTPTPLPPSTPPPPKLTTPATTPPPSAMPSPSPKATPSPTPSPTPTKTPWRTFSKSNKPGIGGPQIK